jgi:hypothetical protein
MGQLDSQLVVQPHFARDVRLLESDHALVRTQQRDKRVRGERRGDVIFDELLAHAGVDRSHGLRHVDKGLAPCSHVFAL